MATHSFESGGAPFQLWCQTHLVDGPTAAPESRSGGTVSQTFDAAEFNNADLLNVHFSDGSVLFTNPRSFAQRYGAAGATRAAGDSRVQLPFVLKPAAAMRSGANGDDGAGTVERYTLARLEEPSTLDRIYELGAQVDDMLSRWFGSTPPAGAALAMKICAAFESSVLQRGADGASGGLLECLTTDGWRAVATDANLAADAGNLDQLLFLHGTASSTEGSFGRLWNPQHRSDNKPPADFHTTCRRYAHVLSFEHRSLTRSPVDNALALLQQLARLPDGSRIDIVSHSRGGLVGELLSLLTVDAADRAKAAQVFDKEFAASKKTERHPDADSVQPLFASLAALQKRAISVRTFVRVACPARGTLLADRRTDLFLSLMARAVGLVFGTNGVPAYEMVVGLAKALVAARAEAKALPGLQAMIPGSQLTRALNLGGLCSNDRLRVIAGDSQGKGWGGITTMLGDVFYGLHDHDFVVHTRSMFGGLARSSAPMSLRLQGPAVTHFSYFGEAESRVALFTALGGGDQGFAQLADDEARTRGLLELLSRDPLCRIPRQKWLDRLREPDMQRRPVLVVLPGSMGSELSGQPTPDGDLIWISPSAVFSGDAAKLELTQNSDLWPSALVPACYERLLKRAREDFRLVPFAFDWRRPIDDSADDLVALLQTIELTCREQGVPVHLLAHSMGGLVARWALFHTNGGRALWATLRDRGSRLLMLGTPNNGSYAPVRALLQQHPICNLVGGLARDLSTRDVAQWCGAYPGLMQMLPVRKDDEYGSLLDPGAWKRIASDDTAAQVPAALHDATSFTHALAKKWDELRADPNVLYVAGCGLTDVALQRPGIGMVDLGEAGFTPVDHITLRQEWCGDGTVSWDSALDERRTWYVAAEHGSLADTPSAFDAYFELLRSGGTSKLRQQQPAQRGAARAGEIRARVPEWALMPPSLPDANEAASWVLGLIPPGDAAGVLLDKIDIKVVFGSLDYARYPLMVGHYLNDRIVSAEKRVDEKLDGQLTQLHDLNLYPGALKTSAYVRPNGRDEAPPAYPGAIIVGLGNVGEMTPATLAETVARAVLRYAFEHRHRDPFVPRDMPEDIRLSTLLIGSHSQAVTMRESLMGFMDGVWRAAKVLAHTPSIKDLVRIREVEIIEMWEHRALEAAYALQQLLKRPEWAKRFHWECPLLEERDGGLFGYAIQTDRDWWQRLIIRHNDLGGMSYALIAEKARVEATQVQSDIASMSSFMDAISDGSAKSSFDDPQMSRVLYEMLLPNDLKSRVANFDNTVLVVDEETACYPWELLAPPRPTEDAAGDDEIKPLAVQAGLIRQRLTDDFRRLPQITSEYNVLVVGAPCTDGWTDEHGKPVIFGELKAAAEEAERVADLLHADPRDWQVTRLIGERCQFDAVRLQLLAKPYRVLHLCGHGVVDQWLRNVDVAGVPMPVRKTGMVLSRQQLLGAGDIDQMSSVPELVFINCCYSGREGSAALPAARRYPTLAASMALQFIRMGAKAVVAAGWRVDDHAAKLFAERFYAEMLRGRPFGEAVRGARGSVHDQFQSRTNTWGAYQCYGDPGWSLATRQRSNTHFGGSSHLLRASQAMSHLELASQISRVVAISGDKAQAALLQQLNRLVDELREDPRRSEWLRTSTSVRASLGEAYREIGDHEKAVEWFQRAASGAYSQLQLRHVELLANSLARLTHITAVDGDASRAEQARGLIDWLAQAPPGLNGSSVTAHHVPCTAASELDSLRGSLALREAADVEAPPLGCNAAGGRNLQIERLEGAAVCFARAWAAKRHLGDFRDRESFALSNFLLTSALSALCASTDRAAQPTTLQALIKRCEQAIDETLRSLGPSGVVAANERAAIVATENWPGSQWVRAADQRMQDLRDDNPRTFWDYTNRVDLAVARCLFNDLLRPVPPLRGTLPPREVVKEAARLLEGALIRWPSPRELESMKARFGLIEKILGRHKEDFDEIKGNVLLDFAEAALTRLDAHRPNAD